MWAVYHWQLILKLGGTMSGQCIGISPKAGRMSGHSLKEGGQFRGVLSGFYEAWGLHTG